MFDFLVSKRKRQEKTNQLAKESLRKKLDFLYFNVLADSAFTGSPLERIVTFFNVMEESLAELTPQELSVAPEELLNVVRTVGRDEYGWFRAPEGSPATNENTFIQPTGHMDEVFYTHSVAQLLAMTDKPTNQGGFAPKPMTNKEFYNYKFVTPFIMDKVEALESAMKKLR